jgi:sensor histidine kinase YesM
MIHIKTKLMLFFIVLILLLSGLAFLLFQNNSRSIEQYNMVLNRFFLLNEIYQKTTQVNTSIQAYVFDPDQGEELLDNYYGQADELLQYRGMLINQIETDANYLIVKNFGRMIDSFLEQGELTIENIELNHQNVYYDHLSQQNKLSKFIQDSTLNLINSELSSYQQFYSTMNSKNDNYQKMGIYVFLTAILLCSIFTFWFSEGITKPIQRLSAAAKQISRGNFNVEGVSVTSRDELRFLTETFNSMCANIRKLVQEIKEKSELDTLVKKMELRSLQNQINPHFLFNTLNMVAKTAFVEGAERTSELVESISALLRYNLKKLHHTVELGDEIGIVKEYFFIQKMRFGDRIRFMENMEESLFAYPLPSLTIQPLVENAFVHGVESYEQGAEMELSVYRNNKQLIVEIRDNGVGMDQQLIRQVMEGPAEPFSGQNEASNGIGLRNVLRRLQIFYQCEDVMEIESVQGTGTTVRLKLPIDAGEVYKAHV